MNLKIEYFDQGQDSPLDLIYGNEPEKFGLLKSSVHLLVEGKKDRIAVHELLGFEGVNGCQLFFSVGATDRGVRLVVPPRSFECSIKSTWWDNIEGLLEPFCLEQPTSSFQFLTYGFSSKIELIISTVRSW